MLTLPCLVAPFLRATAPLKHELNEHLYRQHLTFLLIMRNRRKLTRNRSWPTNYNMMTSSNGNIFRVTGHLCGEFTGDAQRRGALMFSLICTRINGWVNNREAGNLRRHSAHCDVMVMKENTSNFTLCIGIVPADDLTRLNARGPFYGQGLTSIPAWIKSYMSSKVWGEIIYPFPNFNSCTIEVWKWISNFIPHFIMDAITDPYCD